MGQHVTAHFLDAQNFSAIFDVFDVIFGPNFRPFYSTVLRLFLGQFIGLNKMVLLYYIYALYV